MTSSPIGLYVTIVVTSSTCAWFTSGQSLGQTEPTQPQLQAAFQAFKKLGARHEKQLDPHAKRVVYVFVMPSSPW